MEIQIGFQTIILAFIENKHWSQGMGVHLAMAIR
jgi:hypothetical protein